MESASSILGSDKGRMSLSDVQKNTGSRRFADEKVNAYRIHELNEVGRNVGQFILVH